MNWIRLEWMLAAFSARTRWVVCAPSHNFNFLIQIRIRIRILFKFFFFVRGICVSIQNVSRVATRIHIVRVAFVMWVWKANERREEKKNRFNLNNSEKIQIVTLANWQNSYRLRFQFNQMNLNGTKKKERKKKIIKHQNWHLKISRES